MLLTMVLNSRGMGWEGVVEGLGGLVGKGWVVLSSRGMGGLTSFNIHFTYIPCKKRYKVKKSVSASASQAPTSLLGGYSKQVHVAIQTAQIRRSRRHEYPAGFVFLLTRHHRRAISMRAGSWRRALKRLENLATVAPASKRWSAAQLIFMTMHA